uniref:Integrase core domain containing protein n=1 Tax=Solanum tuberosum TaxID=4113 RepID=M1DY23_SOLTU
MYLVNDQTGDSEPTPKVPTRIIGAKGKETKVGTIETTIVTTNTIGTTMATETIGLVLMFLLQIGNLAIGKLGSISRIEDMMYKMMKWFDSTDENVKEMQNDLSGIEMARPKVAGRDMPPRHIREKYFKRDKKIVELAKKRRESKKASSSRRVPIDPTIPSWKCRVHRAINSFLVSHEGDIMVDTNIVAEAKENEHNENQNDNPGTIFEFLANASGNNTTTD